MTAARPASASLLVLVLALASGAACAGGDLRHRDRAYAPDEGVSTVVPDDPAAAFAAVEQRLLGARLIDADVIIDSAGEVPSTLRGRVTLDGAGVQLDVGGKLAGADVDLWLVITGNDLTGGNRKAGVGFSTTTPPAVREALVIGFTRMGFLHNLAVLSAGAPPDHGDGGVAAWVVTSNHAWAVSDDTVLDGQRARALSFDIAVDGRAVAEATLWLDAVTGLPRQRRQTVHFDGGQMTATERYPRFVVTP